MKKILSMVVTTNGNRMLEIDRLFLSIANQSFVNYEIILVLQGFGHNKENEIKSLLHKYNLSFKATLIKSDLVSLSKARNIALNYINGEIVCFPDDDCWYPSDLFKKITERFMSDSINVISCNVFDPIKNLNYGKNRKTKIDEIKISQFNSFTFPISVGIFIKFKNLKHLYFDENIGLGTKMGSGEETDLIHKLLSLGYSIKFISNLIVYHEVSAIINIEKIKSYSRGYGYTIATGIKKHKLFFLIFPFMKYIFIHLIAIFLYSLLLNKLKVRKYYFRFLFALIGFVNGF